MAPSSPEVRRLARRAFSNYGRMLADFALIGALSAEELRSRVELRGLAGVDAVLARGRGCVVALPHTGSWDWAGSAGGVHGYRMFAVADPFPGSLDAAVAADRSRFGLRVIPAGRSAVRAVSDALAANGVVALVCDLEHGPGVEVEFFGRRAIVPGGPAAFALKAGAGLVSAHVWSTGPGRYAAQLEPELEVVASGDRKTSTQAVMQQVIRRFEVAIRRRPDQWFAFRPLGKAL